MFSRPAPAQLGGLVDGHTAATAASSSTAQPPGAANSAKKNEGDRLVAR
jgi:hypothetical protein